MAVCPPFSLLEPHCCPEPRHPLDAPENVTQRLYARERVGCWGGAGGAKATRHFVFSRLRPALRSLRDDVTVTTACFPGLQAGKVVTGGSDGELHLWDATTGEIIEVNVQAHAAGVTLLDTAPACAGGSLLIASSTRTEVKLWDASRVSGAALATLPGVRNGRLGFRAQRLVATTPSEKRALVFDVGSGTRLQSLEDASGGPVIRTAVWADAVWSPDGQLLLWAHALWDPRASGREPVHRFEAFSNSDFGAGAFHPRGGVAVINSEVWDLRTYKLMRSVPALLAGSELKFAGGGDVAYAFLRGGRDESGLAAARRSKNSLRSAFRTIDTVDWSEIATARPRIRPAPPS